MLRLSIGLFALFSVAAAQEVVRMGPGVTAPRPLSPPQPQFSEEGRLAGVNATVRLSLVVSEDGVPASISVTRGAGFGFDEKALESVSTWRFKPGEREGRPVAVMTAVEMSFSLGLGPVARLTFDPGSASRPILQTKAPLILNPAPPAAQVRVDFDVAADGQVSNVRSSNGAPGQALDIIRSWHFSADSTRPATVAAQLELTYK